MRHKDFFFSALSFCLLSALAFWFSPVAYGQNQEKASVFFSQGQAMYSAQDQARSKQAAVQDFLVQGVTQAVAAFLDPSQMGSNFAALQEKILNQPERYVDTYKIFSESPMGGLYRVTGQVSVSMERLRKDLVSLGFTTGDTGSREADTRRPPGGTSSVESAERQVPGGSRGMSVARQEFYWAVAEKWDRGWHLPQDARDPKGLFTLSVIQESQDYGWSLRLPQQTSVTMDPNGNIATNDVLAAAKRAGVRKAVIGTIDYTQGQKAALKVDLRVFDVAFGKAEGEIHRNWPIGGKSNQESALELAAVVVPALDRLLHGQTTRSTQPPASEEPAQAVQRSGASRATGEWTLMIRGEHRYASWEELRNTLLEQFKSMQIKSIEFDLDAIRIKLEGVDGQYISSLEGSTLGRGITVQVSGFSPESRSIALTLSRSVRP